MVSEMHKLLEASIEILQKDQEIDRLKWELKRCNAKIALLESQVDILAYKRSSDITENLSCLLKPQI